MGDDGVVHQQKLRVVYLPAEEGTFDEEEENYLPVAEPPGAQDYVSSCRSCVNLSVAHILDSKTQ